MKKEITVDSEMQAALAMLLKTVRENQKAYWTRNNYQHTMPNMELEICSPKWAKISEVTTTADGRVVGHSVRIFICLQDNHTKTLGNVYRGGIYKPASWQTPAKHQRGNLFQPNWQNYLTDFGVMYLRG